jgi:DNA-directed RNA polymerase I, II, and III subunit RPABC5
MIIPIKCFTCGTVIADKYQYFLRQVRERKLSNIKPGDASTHNIDKSVYLTNTFNQKTAEGEVMDELGLYKMCCRRHMLTHVDIE